jgi:hypothetical protein
MRSPHLLLLAFTLLTYLHPGQTTAQSTTPPLFPGAEHLESCLVDLPLTYAKKDKERYTQAARGLKDVELVYLTVDKKTKVARYSRVYVVVATFNDGDHYVYVESVKDHLNVSGAKTALFPKYTPSRERFYKATCFDAQLSAHPELKGVVQEQQPRATSVAMP